jgi:acyl carrier protein
MTQPMATRKSVTRILNHAHDGPKGKKMTNLRDKIITAIQEIADMRGTEVDVLADETVLLESGLDSLGFAILVARLEEDLGYDPFVLMNVPVYPRTLAEFIEIYQRFAPQ